MRLLVLSSIGLLAAGCDGLVGNGNGNTGGGTGGAGGAGGGSVTTGGDGGDTSSAACRVVALLNARCVSCHSNPPKNAAPMVLDSLDALKAPSLKDTAQTNAQRSIARLRDTAMPMPPAPEAPGTGDEAALIETWVAAGMPACTAPPGDGGQGGGGGAVMLEEPNLIPQGELFSCTAGVQSDATTRVRRVNRWSWTRNVGGPVTRSWTGFSFFDNPLDPSAGEPYSTYATDETVDESMVEITLPIVQSYGESWAGPYTGDNRLDLLRLDTSLRCMWQDDAPTAACIRHYLSVLLERGVVYRPPRTDELDRLVAFTNAVLAQEVPDGGQDPRTHTLVRIVTAAMMTSGALFREELGAPDAGRVALSSGELATQLTYALGARGPGAVPTYRYPYVSAPMEGYYADVVGAAKDGGIRSAAVVDALVRKHVGGYDPTRFDLVQDFGDPRRGRRGEWWLGDGSLLFFREWLGYTKVDTIFKERPEATSAFDDGDTSVYRAQLAAWGNLMDGYYGDESLLIQQMDDLVARAVIPDTDVLKTLLTTRMYFLPASVNTGNDLSATRYTGQPYGTQMVINATNAERWRSMPVNERAGVLTHPAWLASHGGNFEDDPSAVHRGKWVREQLLCGYVPPLSQVRVVAQVGPHRDDKNARARLLDATGKSECQGCHGLMNPLGLPFETYNHAGYLRVKDHAPDGGFMAPDGTVTLMGMPDPALNGPVRDGVDLAEKLASSAHVKRCFLRQAFRYYMGRNENRTDACTLAAMEQAYDSNGGSFKAALSALMTSDTWTSRRVPGVNE